MIMRQIPALRSRLHSAFRFAAGLRALIASKSDARAYGFYNFFFSFRRPFDLSLSAIQKGTVNQPHFSSQDVHVQMVVEDVGKTGEQKKFPIDGGTVYSCDYLTTLRKFGVL
jgi:hypothetical protein